MAEDFRYLCSKDRNLRLARHPNLKKDCLAVMTPLGSLRWVNSFRYLRVGETKVGIIADYFGETRSTCSYVSFWDGRDGLFLSGQVQDDSYYIPWMECFALGVKVKHKQKLEYSCVAAEKRNRWITDVIRVFNEADSAEAKVEFSKDYGFFILSNSGESFTMDEIKVSGGAVEITANLPQHHIFRAELTQGAKELYKIPNTVRRRYDQKEVIEA